jgi:NADH:ubiquinone oxidoreductase subunit H
MDIVGTIQSTIGAQRLDALAQFGIDVGIILIKIVVVLGIALLHVAYATYFERKVIGHMQVRIGPMRVGPHGLLQPIADGIKLFFKEDVIPTDVDRPVFYLSPIIFMGAAMASLAFIPFQGNFVIACFFRDGCLWNLHVWVVIELKICLPRWPEVNITGYQL